MLYSYTWRGATVCGHTDRKRFYHCRKSCWKVLIVWLRRMGRGNSLITCGATSYPGVLGKVFWDSLDSGSDNSSAIVSRVWHYTQEWLVYVQSMRLGSGPLSSQSNAATRLSGLCLRPKPTVCPTGYPVKQQRLYLPGGTSSEIVGRAKGLLVETQLAAISGRDLWYTISLVFHSQTPRHEPFYIRSLLSIYQQLFWIYQADNSLDCCHFELLFPPQC